MKTTVINTNEMKRLGIEETPYKNFFNTIEVVIHNKKVQRDYNKGYLYDIKTPAGGFFQRQNISKGIFCRAKGLVGVIEHLEKAYTNEKFELIIFVKEMS